jgi:peptidoglycan/xylan/chitin deacetylase (PgdA/CDA1 family)
MTSYAAHLADDTVAIFLFHGVVREHRHPVRNYTRKHIALADFRKILTELRQAGTPVTMDDIVAAHDGQTSLPKRAFVVTFDDGFENNHSLAAPALRDADIPAMFYVTSGFVADGSASWTDMVEYAVERCDTVRLSLPYPGLAGSFTSVPEKIELLDRMRATVKGNQEIDPYAFAQRVWDELGIKQMDPDAELDRKMTWAQVRELGQSSFFSVGGHGHTHRILSFLSDAALKEEIDRSMSMLRQAVGRDDLSHFSYPEGLTHCFSPRVIALLREAGVRCSPTAEPGANRAPFDLFRLRRFMVV